MINIPKAPLKFAFHYLSKTRWIFVFILVIVPIMALCNQLVPWFISRIVSLVNTGGTPNSVWPQVEPLIIKLGLIIITAQILSYLMNLGLQIKCIGPLGTIIRDDLFAKILPQSKCFWNTHQAGDIYDKMSELRRSVAAQSSLGNIIMSVLYPVCIISVNLYLLAQIYIPLSIVCAFSFVVVTLAFVYISKSISQLAAEKTRLQARVFGRVVDLISNFFLIKTFGSGNSEKKNIGNDFSKLADIRAKINLTTRKQIFTQDGLFLFFQISLIGYTIYLWSQKLIAVGDIVFILSTTGNFVNMLGGLCWTITDIQNRRGNISKALETFNLPYQINDSPNAVELKKVKGLIEIKNLNFSYKPGEKPVFHNFNLTIPEKQKVGIVGISGCGKTTLLHLLQRIEDTPDNSIFIDGKDITQIKEHSLHQTIAFIPQDTSLFHRTIKENISYGKFNATDKEIKTAAQKSFANKFIDDFPRTYQTLVGDKGVKLSGGQRQRVGIARAVLKNAPILLLDEATSALDSQSEDYIQKSLTALIENKTVVIVAHRLSTLKNMDRIIVIDKGKIIEDGTPKELLEQGGKFTILWNLQK